MTQLSVAEFRRRRRDKCSEFLERNVAQKKGADAQQEQSMNEGNYEAKAINHVHFSQIKEHLPCMIRACPMKLGPWGQ
jgi:hypothetical protein